MRFKSEFIICFFCWLLLIAIANPVLAFEEYFIVSTGDTILVGKDIESYNRVSYRLALTEAGYAKWKSYENQPPPEGRTLVEKTLLTDRAFKIIYSGEVVAEGHIVSGTESHMHTGLNLWDSQTSLRQSRLKFGYFRFEPDMPLDPRNSEAFWAYFQKNGKLIEE